MTPPQRNGKFAQDAAINFTRTKFEQMHLFPEFKTLFSFFYSQMTGEEDSGIQKGKLDLKSSVPAKEQKLIKALEDYNTFMKQ